MSWPSCLSALLQAFQPKWCSSSPQGRQVRPADDRAVARRLLVHVDDGERVGPLPGAVEGDDVGQVLARRGGGLGGGAVERGVGDGHGRHRITACAGSTRSRIHSAGRPPTCPVSSCRCPRVRRTGPDGVDAVTPRAWAASPFGASDLAGPCRGAGCRSDLARVGADGERAAGTRAETSRSTPGERAACCCRSCTSLPRIPAATPRPRSYSRLRSASPAPRSRSWPMRTT